MSEDSSTRLILLSNSFHQATLVVMVPILQKVYGLSLSSLGAIIGGGLLVSACATPIWGRIATKTGPRKALRRSAIGSLVGILMLSYSFALAQSSTENTNLGLFFLVAARLIYSASAAAVLPVAQAIRSNQSDSKSLLGAIGSLNAMNGIGRVTGNAFVTPLLLAGPAMPIVIVIPAYLYALIRLAREQQGLSETTSVSESKTPSGLGALPMFAMAIAATVQISIGAAYVLLAPLILARVSADAAEATSAAGIALTFALLCGIFTQLVLTQLFSGRLYLALTSGIFILFLGLLGLAEASTQIQLSFAACTLAIGTALALSANLTARLQETPKANRSQTSTWLASAQMLGLACGTSLFAYLGDIDLTLALRLAALLVCLIFIAVLISRALPVHPLSPRKGTSE
ncbi:MFS transporter [Labrenzia sp. CE80]|uniref:MFS transporter n=1 Tax=Labrenzia sp. CE80 TaxID=1788986 RepID=UPI00129B2EC2|nr:MFS transporter [Labrenzia sp. CE80]